MVDHSFVRSILSPYIDTVKANQLPVTRQAQISLCSTFVVRKSDAELLMTVKKIIRIIA